MPGVAIPEAKFSRAFDDQARLADLIEADESDFPAAAPKLVTDDEIDALIQRIDEQGDYEDALGKSVKASSLIKAIAEVWMDDPMFLPGAVFIEFHNWAQQQVRIAKFGKPNTPTFKQICTAADCCYRGQPKASTCLCSTENK